MDPVREAELATSLAALGDRELARWPDVVAVEQASFDPLPASAVAAVALTDRR
jgi:hypothetical protein